MKLFLWSEKNKYWKQILKRETYVVYPLELLQG